MPKFKGRPMTSFRFAVVVLLTFLAARSLAAAEPAEPKPFTSKDGRFTISFPGKPETTTSALKTPDGEMDLHIFKFARKDKELYTVVYSDYPVEKLNQADPERRLDAARDGGLDATHGKLVKETKIKADGFQGRDIEIELQGVSRYSRMILVRNRLYVIMAVPDNGKTAAADAKKFLDSFKLAPAKEENASGAPQTN
jgi:hypothetical protein